MVLSPYKKSIHQKSGCVKYNIAETFLSDISLINKNKIIHKKLIKEIRSI